MSVPENPDQLSDRIPLSVVTTREPVKDNPWITERWRVVGVIAGQAQDSGKISRTLLRYGPDSEQFLWTGFVLRLRPPETDAYYYNIIGQNPSLYVYCEDDDSGEPRPRSITAEYIDAMSHSECGNTTFSVPMPPEVYRCIERYVLEHHIPEEPKMKRKQDREAKRADKWSDG
jgi:Protein of unknown function (DUF3305)